MTVLVRFLFVYISSFFTVSNITRWTELSAITTVSPIEHIAEISSLLVAIYCLKKLVIFEVIEGVPWESAISA
jgi:hypothetical protein